MNDKMENNQTAAAIPKARLIQGGLVFFCGQLAPLFIPLVIASDFSSSTKTALTALLVLGIPELAILATVLILGKTGFMALRSMIYHFLKRHICPPPNCQSTTLSNWSYLVYHSFVARLDYALFHKLLTLL